MVYDEIVRTHYFHEVERRRDLNSSLTLPLGVLTALFAAIAAMLGSISIPFDRVEQVLAILCGFSALAGGVAISYALRAVIGYTYRHPTSMGSLAQWREKALSEGISRHRVDEDIQQIMADQYAQGAEKNSVNNDRKSGYIHTVGIWVAICLALVILSGLPYVYSRMMAAPTFPPAGGAA
jgi:hypothetical protein